MQVIVIIDNGVIGLGQLFSIGVYVLSYNVIWYGLEIVYTYVKRSC